MDISSRRAVTVVAASLSLCVSSGIAGAQRRLDYGDLSVQLDPPELHTCIVHPEGLYRPERCPGVVRGAALQRVEAMRRLGPDANVVAFGWTRWSDSGPTSHEEAADWDAMLLVRYEAMPDAPEASYADLRNYTAGVHDSIARGMDAPVHTGGDGELSFEATRVRGVPVHRFEMVVELPEGQGFRKRQGRS